jgi:hypothetical protein
MEQSPGCVAVDTPGVKLAFMSENFTQDPNKQQSAVITGKRGAGKPRRGQPQFTGQVVAAPYAPQMGYLMKALCGAPTTSPDAIRSLTAAAVQQITPEAGCADTVVGLPCPNHGFVQDSVITVHGTTNYDGEYRVARGVTTDLIAIEAPYIAETLTANAKIYRGRAPLLEGEAVDLGDGTVGLPVHGNMHSLNTGDTITITGTTNYDGTYKLTAQCGKRMLIITHAYEAETFDGTVPAVPSFWRHKFALPKHQPTVTMEKYLDYDPDLPDLKPYQRFSFCKVSQCAYNLGGDDELNFTIDFAVGAQRDSATPLDPEPTVLEAVRIENIESAIWVNDIRRGDVETASFTNNFNVTARAAIGDLGQFSRMSEGDPEISAQMQVFAEEIDWKYLSDAALSVPYNVSFAGAAGEEVWLRYPESEISTVGVPISGKEGLMGTVNVISFVDCKESVLEWELINRVESYA